MSRQMGAPAAAAAGISSSSQRMGAPIAAASGNPGPATPTTATPKESLRRRQCGESLKAHAFLLDKDCAAQDWVGYLQGDCHGCSELHRLTKREFEKVADKRWTERKINKGNASKRARQLLWESEDKKLQELFPGASNAERRKLCKERFNAVSKNILASLNKKNEFAKQAPAF